LGAVLNLAKGHPEKEGERMYQIKEENWPFRSAPPTTIIHQQRDTYYGNFTCKIEKQIRFN
jgi:hypothetical protein